MKERSKKPLFASVFLGSFLMVWIWNPAPSIPRSSGSFPHEAYVWQRQWDDTTREAITSTGAEFSSLTILAAEVTWPDGIPNIDRIHPNYEALHKIDRPIGLAIRIESYPGTLGDSELATNVIKELALSLVNESTRHPIQLSEIQLDYDCPESKLGNYQRWVANLKKAIDPFKLGITALPSWLDQPACQTLFSTADRVVLQVHSLQAPKINDLKPMLCDPLTAKRAVEKMASFDIPFRVALPTYTYLLAYDPQGQLAGLSAEGPKPNWPDTYQVHPLEAEPSSLCRLVNTWTEDRPARLEGIIWYRLPVARDRQNWSWPTLKSVMAGRQPSANLRVIAHSTESGLFDLTLANEGSMDHKNGVTIHVAWETATYAASDALSTFKMKAFNNQSLTLQMENPNWRLAPNTSIPLAWLRLTSRDELDIKIETQNSD